MSKISREELNDNLKVSIDSATTTAEGLTQLQSSFNTHVNAGIHIHSSGSNANGYWIRYEDGTLICYHTIQQVTPNAEGKISGVWISPYAYPDGMPRPYFDANVAYNYFYGDTDVPQNRVVSKITGGLTSMLLNYVIKFEATTEQYEKDIALLLIGRWKL